MTSMSQSACKSLMSSGLEPRVIYPILDEIKRWIHSCGEEWTISRLKTLKQAYINLLAGKPSFGPETWIKNDGVLPKGPWRRVFLLKKPQKALSALMVYSSWTSKEVTKSQKEKFYSALGPGELANFEHIVQKVNASQFVKDNGWSHSDHFKSVSVMTNKETRSPTFVEDTYSAEKHHPDNLLKTAPTSLDSLVQSLQHPLLDSWFDKNQHRLPSDGQSVYSAFVMTGVDDCIQDNDPCVGVISHIQEPGYKLRAVANPLLGFQYALSSMGHTLYSALRDLPEDCTFDQHKGIIDAQMEMKKGVPLMAIDLSNATDVFPYSVTRSLLGAFGFDQSDLKLFDAVARGDWQDKIFGRVKWERGQPLGLYPSFAAFALSHHSVVRSCKPSFYRILGDDVVVDREAGNRLLKTYAGLGLEVSPSKTIDSALLTEFAGRIITPDRVFTQPKWREISDRSFFDFARNMGPSVVKLLRPRQQIVVKLFSEVPTDIHPFGLGWNPDGKTYADRVTESQPLIDLLKRPVLDGSSKTVRSLDELKLAIELSTYHDHHKVVDLESDHDDSQFGSLDERVLANVGVTHADFDQELPKTFMSEISYISDPRGVSTLESLESRYVHAGPNLSL